MDFASNASVREAAAKINNQVDHIDIMLLTAGVMALKEFQTSEDGIEMQFAANYVGHFLLTCLLIDKVLAAARMGKGPTRIVNMTSEGHTISQVRLDDWNFSVSRSLGYISAGIECALLTFYYSGRGSIRSLVWLRSIEDRTDLVHSRTGLETEESWH